MLYKSLVKFSAGYFFILTITANAEFTCSNDEISYIHPKKQATEIIKGIIKNSNKSSLLEDLVNPVKATKVANMEEISSHKTYSTSTLFNYVSGCNGLYDLIANQTHTFKVYGNKSLSNKKETVLNNRYKYSCISPRFNEIFHWHYPSIVQCSALCGITSESIVSELI